MKTKVLDNIITSDELFFIYKEIVSTSQWNITALSTRFEEEGWQKRYNGAPNLKVKIRDDSIEHYPFYIWGKTIVYRIKEKLVKENMGLSTNIKRMWFNITYSDNTHHWSHRDSDKANETSLVLFLTPIWNPDWKGSFYVDGEEFNFKPGSVVVFDGKEFHMGTSPVKNTYGWMRLSCNIMLEENKNNFNL